ncbi:MAG: hypothetical protein RSA98_10085 [Odoribacter sp.]
MTKIVIKKVKKVMPMLLPPNAIVDTAKALKCSRTTVWGALRNNRRGPVSDRVRAYVLENYGTAVGNESVND